jgi:GntR family transcriptional regulator
MPVSIDEAIIVPRDEVTDALAFFRELNSADREKLLRLAADFHDFGSPSLVRHQVERRTSFVSGWEATKPVHGRRSFRLNLNDLQALDTTLRISNCPVNRMTRVNVTEAALQSRLDRPLYLQLLDRLREDLSRRQPGALIDSEPQLARRFGVSRFTVTRAIEILVRDGLLTRRQGLGTFVAPPRLRRAPTYLRSFTEAMAAEGRTATHRLLDFELINGADGHNFSYADGTPLLRLERLRLVDGAPLAVHCSVLNANIAQAAGLTKAVAADPHFSLYRLFRDGGVAIDRGVETLQARLATRREAQLLQLDGSRVVMTAHRETYAKDGSLIDVDDAVHDARQYAYETEIRRGDELTPPFSEQRETAHVSNSNHKRSFGARISKRDTPVDRR